MADETKTSRDADVEADPSAELGLRNPVRDKEKLGDTQYSVTPPRDEVVAPETQGHEPHRATCPACQSDLDPMRSYRPDGEEYIYQFCGTDCYARWRTRADATTPASPRDPGS
jgi:hypothetical protein